MVEQWKLSPVPSEMNAVILRVMQTLKSEEVEESLGKYVLYVFPFLHTLYPLRHKCLALNFFNLLIFSQFDLSSSCEHNIPLNFMLLPFSAFYFASQVNLQSRELYPFWLMIFGNVTKQLLNSATETNLCGNYTL